MEGVNESVNIPEVAETETDVQEVTNEGEKEQEVTEPAPTERDYQKDADFAAMRRALEAANQEKLKITSERDRLARTLRYFDFKGNSADEIADDAEAHYLGKSVEEIRSERIAHQEQDEAQRAKDNELEYLRNREVERVMNEDLKRIQKIDPNVKSIAELGDRFFSLLSAHVDAVDAFNVIRASDTIGKKTPPPEIGKVNSTDKADKTFFTQAEVDAMVASNSKELDDPNILAKIRKSMTKW